MANEEKKETGFDKKVIYDEKGDYQVLNTNNKDEKAKATTTTETEKAKRTLADKLPKASPKPLSNPAADAKTTPLEELDLKTPKVATGLNSLKPEPAKVDPKEPPKPEPAKVDPKEPPKPEPAKVDSKEPSKPEPTKADSKKEPPKPEPAKADSKEPPKPEPAKTDSKEPLKPEPAKVDSKEPLKPEPAKVEPKEPSKTEGLSKMNLGATPVKTPATTETEPTKPEAPKEEPKKETISPFELHPLADLCAKLHYDISEFISVIRKNQALLATNPQERFYMENCKSLIIHGVRMIDDSGTLLIHIETESVGHAIIKVSSNAYQDCTGAITLGQLVTADVGGKTLSLTSMAFSPKLRFIK